ncbi:MAG: SAM-dependent methyltransferase [Acidimicrobiales bacterium]
MAERTHWREWHEHYEDPASSISRRLLAVQRRLADALDQAPAGPIRLISMCAGQGRDVVGVLSGHPRNADVAARLVEGDTALVHDARQAAAALTNVEVVQGDAAMTSAYEDFVPAGVILACGIFGNISPDDIATTISELPRLCAPGAVVIWTRHHRAPDFTPTIREWFGGAGFEEVGFDTEDGWSYSVGTHRLDFDPLSFRSGRHLFSFDGDGKDAGF